MLAAVAKFGVASQRVLRNRLSSSSGGRESWRQKSAQRQLSCLSGQSSNMMSIAEMFYGEVEHVWIVKPEKEEKKKDDKSEAPKPAAPDPLEVCFGKYFPFWHPPLPAPPAPEQKPPKEQKVAVLKAPICCHTCTETVVAALKGLKGVKKVDCDIRKEKVTVELSTASADEVLLECRKLKVFNRLWRSPNLNQVRLWGKDD